MWRLARVVRGQAIEREGARIMTLLNGALLSQVPFQPQRTTRTVTSASSMNDLLVQITDQIILCDCSVGALPGPILFPPSIINKGQEVEICKIDATATAIDISDGGQVVMTLNFPAQGGRVQSAEVLSLGISLLVT